MDDDTQTTAAEPLPDEPVSDASYWYERAERLERERADWKRWCEEHEATIEQMETRLDALCSAAREVVDEVGSGLFDGLTKEALVDIVGPLAALVVPESGEKT